MSVPGKSRQPIKDLSPFKLILLITSPFALSFLIHTIILTLSAYTTWYIASTNTIDDDPAATILLTGTVLLT